MTIKRAKVLPDLPAIEDGFHGGGHQRSALALANAVEQLADKDGAIGLEGPWGAGKSTVINLAEKDISSNENGKRHHHVFTFDLWLHHPEILKLAFLEEFIAWAKTKKFLTEKQREEFSKRISDREVNTRVENKREFSFSGILFVLFFPVLPLIYTWLSPLAFTKTAQDAAALFTIHNWNVSAHSLAVIGLAGLYGIFVLAVLLKWASPKVASFRAALSSGARLFSRETDFDEIKQYVRERNPTSEEFQSFFREILSVVQKKNNRIVFVFDNIDRLPAKSVPKVWSDCRSIFAMRGRDAQPDNSSVTAIVPYDASYIADAFADGESGKSLASERGENLIRKTFDITVRVAPPLSTDWKKLLEAKLDEAFPEPLSENAKYKIFKLFDIQSQDSATPPTPRNIISYVNEIGAVWNQWGDKIDATHIALYVLVRRRLEGSPEAIRTTGYITPRQARVLGDDEVLRSIAALHYNVEPEHAYQVLLGQDIAKLTIGRDSEAFVKLYLENGFQEVFPDIVLGRAEQWARDGGEDLAAAAVNMSLEGVAGDYLQEAWQHLSEATLHLDKADSTSPEDYIGLAHIVRNVEKSQARNCAKTLVDWFSRNLPSADEQTSDSGRSWVQFFTPIYVALVEAIGESSADTFLKSTTLPKGSKFALGVCAECSSDREFAFDDFRRAEGDGDIKPKLLELVATDLELLRDVLIGRPKFVKTPILGELTTKLCDRLQAENLDSSHRALIVRLLEIARCEYERADSTAQPIKARADDGSLIWHVMAAIGDGDEDTSGALIWLVIDVNGGSETPSNPGNHPTFGDLNPAYTEYPKYLGGLTEESEEVKKIAELAALSKSFSSWLEFAINKQKPEFFRTVFRRIVQDDKFKSLAVLPLVKAFDSLSSILSDDLLATLLKRLSYWSGSFDKTFSGDSALAIPPNMLRKIHELKLDRYEGLDKCVDDYLNDFGKSEWSEVLSGNNHEALSLLLVRIQLAKYKPPLEPYRDALQDHASQILDGDVLVSDGVEDRSDIFEGLKKNTLEKVARDVLVNLKDVTTTRESVEHFLLHCLPLAELLPLNDHPDLAVDQIVTPIVGSTNDNATKFLEQQAPVLKKCVASAGKEVVGRLMEALEAVQRQDQDGMIKASNVADILGVELPKEEVEKVSEEGGD